MVALTSADGLTSLLSEPDLELQIYALKKLNELIHQFWTEASDYVGKIELLYEDEKFPFRGLAALVASKIYYHLGEFEDSLNFAMGAEKYFDDDMDHSSEYVETIIAKCIDKYISIRLQQYSSSAISSPTTQQPPPKFFDRLQDVVEKMFKQCLSKNEFKQAIGVALEARRLDIIQAAIRQQPSASEDLLQYTLKASLTLVHNMDFRNKVLRLLVQLFNELKNPDYISISQCLVFLRDPDACADMLKALMASGDIDKQLIAYQIAFDVYESATQDFLTKLIEGIPVSNAEEKVTVENAKDCSIDSKIRLILSGQKTIQLQLEFLYRSNKADLAIIKKSKESLESRNSMHHSGLTFSNAFMNAGTTNDQFLRDNMEWLSRATNWSKFSATAALGVIHKGHLSQGKSLLQPYLPQDGVAGSSYSEGGALFALGLIHANHGSGILEYLLNIMKGSQAEVLQHGACLGLGVAGMATYNESVYEALKGVLFSDSAVAGEAAGYAMGLVMLGTASQKPLDEMLQYAHETKHEKIIRGLALGMALIMYGMEEAADTLIEQLVRDKDPLLRYGGIYTIALAYSGTGNNNAIRRLLHLAVSDVNDDVRRASVTALGFILFRTPEQVPRVVQLLSESYNPHVRYGSALALGISCAGRGLKDALDLLEPMTKDPVDFVRQGAFIAMAMILVQQNENANPKGPVIRKQMADIVADNREDVVTKLGCILGQGVIDAGGRNVAISLQSAAGHSNMSAIVGMTLFLQYWYWFPLAHFLSLSFIPTAVIGINKHLQIPQFEFVSNAPPSQFAYVPQTPPPVSTTVEKVATAVLSTTAKAKARAKNLEREKSGDETMDVDSPTEEEKPKSPEESAATVAAPKETSKEPSSEKLKNLSRVILSQGSYISFSEDERYVPVKKMNSFGIVLLKDKKPSEKEEIIEVGVPKGGNSNEVDKNEPAPPAAFEVPNV